MKYDAVHGHRRFIFRLARLARAAAWFPVACALAGPGVTAADPFVGTDAEYLMRKWETEEGLPENSATAIVQTPQGYLWIGTFGGLARFDGVRFTVYNESNTPQLPSEGIVNLHLDRTGRLWVSTLGGMAVLADDRWRTFGQADGWVGDYVRSFAERANGDLLATTFNGYVLEFTGNRWKALPTPPGERGQGYFGFVDEVGRWSVVQHQFIGHYDGSRWHERMVPVDVASSHIAAAPARDGGQWILLGRELHKYRQGELFFHRTLEELRGGIWSMVEDSAGNVWISSYDQGLYRFDLKGNSRHWSTDKGLVSNGVRCVFEDREQNIWVGTSGGGLMHFSIRRARGFGEAEGLQGRVVNSISPDAIGNVWIATYDKGLYQWNGTEMTRVRLSDAGNSATATQSVLADSQGRVWVGTYGDGLWRIEGGRVTCIGDNEVGDGNILALFEDSRGRIWCGGGNKFAKFEAGSFQIHGPERGLPGGGATCFAEDRSGAIWLANPERVYRQNEQGLKEVTDERGKSIERVLCLFSDSTGGIWMGLARGGMIRWRNGEIRRIGATNGLALDSVHGIVEQGGALWLVTNRGVVRGEVANFHAVADGKGELVCLLLDKADGLPSEQFPSGRQPVCGLDARGHLWVATHKGAAIIDPLRFRINAVPPPSALEQLIYQSPSRDTQDRNSGRAGVSETRVGPPFATRVVLPPGSRRIEIHYTGLSLTSPDKVGFQIKLDGWEDNWQVVGNRRVATYHELSPGDYVFHVRAANNDGMWNSTGAKLALRVLPSYWQTVWFRSGGALLLVASSSCAAWWVAHSRQRRSRQVDERFRRVVEAAPSAMIVINPRGHMVLVNTQAETVFGYDRSELIGQPIEMLVPDWWRQAHPGYLSDGLVEPSALVRARDREYFGRRKDNREVPVEIGLTRFESSPGSLILMSIVDISQRRQQELELAHQRTALAHFSRVTALGELSGSLAHELNQPLTAILSNAQAAQRFMAAKEPNLDEVREILAEIVEDDNRASSVIRRLRALFRKDDCVFENVDLAAVIADVAMLVHSDAVLRHVEMDLNVDPQLPHIRGDKIQLQQVILNLLLNAFDVLRDFAADDRRVVVEARVAGQNTIAVRVRDNGPGLQDDLIESIFQPFFTTKATGMGMGLPISRSIIEAHGGTLGVDNNPDAGATFWFTLPIDNSSAVRSEDSP